MSDFEWLETAAKAAIPIIWIALKVLQGVKKTRENQQSTPAPTPRPQPSLPSSSPSPVPSPRQAPAPGLARALNLYKDIGGRIDGLVGDQEALIGRLRARGPRGAVLLELLREDAGPTLRNAKEAIEGADAGDLLTGALRVDLMSHDLDRVARQHNVVRISLDLAKNDAMDRVLADAEAISDACLAPLRQFADFHEVKLPKSRPVCLPAGVTGHLMVDISLLGPNHPVIFVPHDFAGDLMWWPSISHELGHVILRGVPGLLQEMGQAAGWTMRPDLLQVQGGRVVGSPLQAWSAWREELFCDALTVLMLGPAAVEGFLATFSNPEQPDAVLMARAGRGRYAPHPPAHLRLHLAAFLLEEVGFIVEGRALARRWNEIHGFPEILDAEDASGPSLMLPLADGRLIGMAMDHALRRGTDGMRAWLHTQYRALAGHDVLAMPGFDLGPGLWARVERTSQQLRQGTVPSADARVLLAAAIHAGAEGAAVGAIGPAVQRAIRGRGEGRVRPGTKVKRAAGPDSLRSAMVDALVLQEVLVRRAGSGAVLRNRSPLSRR